MLQTLEEYAAECLPSTWAEEFRRLCQRNDNGTLPDTRYCEAINDLVLRHTPAEALARFGKALRSDFGLGNCSFTPHFIARLLARFRKSVVDFIMEQVGRLAKCCRKYKKERSCANGITLVMDPLQMKFITIFAR